MTMVQRQIEANGITINVEDRGPEGGAPILFVNGYTSTMMSWPAELMDGLKARGFRVIRYDNRDVGKSEKLKGQPNIREVAASVREGKAPDIPYTLADMAADGIGVLDALGIERAHVMGISMGGMIVQKMAINHADRLISVTSIMSTTGNPDLPQATDEALAALQAQPASEDREEILRHRMKGRRVYQSPAYPRSDEALYELCAREYDHMYYPEGGLRQYAAIVGDGSRVERLKDVAVPFLVIHGLADPLVPPEGGIDTARSVPGAKLELVEGMGHDMPVELCPRYVELIAAHADAAK
ncbi:alpha/beta fold hydrolase [Parvibaculum sedimenti]|uniref:Alpha/beta fold hydrolase n=1 Tax=Parvibaculum sedimenti TaxID=2608632 RepID=A0A6N6VG25_9HYPH|nr:alpha/beta fold hydrolase [Parvibaculum sedimenti]KAB7738844.1 alpha/beta fold hydrolase [Parvibaculum sedimenti]